MSRKDIASLEDIINYHFNDKTLLKAALFHAPASKNASVFQRLEFLGDRVLDLVVAFWLYQDFSNITVSEMSEQLSQLVRGTACLRIARKIQLSDYLETLSPSEKALGDAVESLLAAIFLDGGLEASLCFVKRFWKSIFVSKSSIALSSQSKLFIWTKLNKKHEPVFITIDQHAEKCNERFETTLIVDGFPPLIARGTTYYKAQENASNSFLLNIRKLNIRKNAHDLISLSSDFVSNLDKKPKDANTTKSLKKDNRTKKDPCNSKDELFKFIKNQRVPQVRFILEKKEQKKKSLYEAELILYDIPVSRGCSKSAKDAEQEAAFNFLKINGIGKLKKEIIEQTRVPLRNYKGILAEWIDFESKTSIVYKVVKIEKEEGGNIFICEVEVEGYAPCRGKGKTIKTAEANAAYNLLTTATSLK
jgi:ribonuclease-3